MSRIPEVMFGLKAGLMENDEVVHGEYGSYTPLMGMGRVPRTSPRGSFHIRPDSARAPARGSTNFAEGLVEDEPKPWFSKFVIFPGTLTGSWWLESWDLYIVVMVLCVAYYEPYAFALYDVGEEPYYLVVLNHILNVSFAVDMCMQAFIACPRSEDSPYKDLWESNPVTLFKTYCGVPCSGGGKNGWFWFDLLAIVPGWLLAFVNSSNPLLMLRILRLFQTARLRRITKLSEWLHARTGYPQFLAECFKFVLITTLTCHWMACVWLMAEGRFSNIMGGRGDVGSWLSVLIDTKGDTCSPDAERDRFCTYTLAYYWATMTLTGVGYGDITPQNQLEYVVALLCMTIVGYVWAYIVGTIVSILSSINPEAGEFKRNLDELNNIMNQRNLPLSLQVRLRHYMHETRHFTRLRSQRELVEHFLSNGLQREVAARSAEVSSLLKGVFWMHELEDEPILDIVRAMHPVAYGQYELMNVRECMLTIQKGIAGVKGRVLARGDCWGHNDILIETPQLIDGTMPRTISFVECLVLTKRSLLEVCRIYPRADRRLRRAQIRTATARAFCQAALRAKRLRSRRLRDSEMGELMQKSRQPQQQHLTMNAARDACTSFVHPGAQRVINWSSPADEFRCDLPELRRLLLTVVTNQDDMSNRLASLEESVKGLEVHRHATQCSEADRTARTTSAEKRGWKQVWKGNRRGKDPASSSQGLTVPLPAAAASPSRVSDYGSERAPSLSPRFSVDGSAGDAESEQPPSRQLTDQPPSRQLTLDSPGQSARGKQGDP